MRRLLQFGILLFLLVMFLAPLAELFDRLEAPRLSNDTEFGIFALFLALFSSRSCACSLRHDL